MSLINQIQKAKRINSTICLLHGCNHKHVTGCRSTTDPAINYQQVIQPTGKEMIGGHPVCIYSVDCRQVTALGMENCKGNGHCHTLCQHAISGLWAAIKALGKRIRLCATFANAKRLLNLYKRAGGRIVKILGGSGFVYAIII
jgi:hypothetical protein